MTGLQSQERIDSVLGGEVRMKMAEEAQVEGDLVNDAEIYFLSTCIVAAIVNSASTESGDFSSLCCSKKLVSSKERTRTRMVRIMVESEPEGTGQRKQKIRFWCQHQGHKDGL